MQELILPGDELEIFRKDKRDILIGPGLRKDNQNTIVATKAGRLRKRENVFWIDSHQKRYVPVRNEYVIGVVTNKSSETIKLDIGSSEYASLSFLAFENATKRNKPQVEIGDLIYARLLTGNKEMEPELVCIDSNGKASGLGVLKEGFVFKCNLEFSRRLLQSSNNFLRELSKHVPPFEITIGMNGRIWIKSGSIKNTISLYEAIKNYASVNEEDTEDYIKSLDEKMQE